MDLMSKFAERFRELMLDNNITVKVLCKDIDCSDSSVNEWLSGNSNYMPSIANLLKLADYFKCSLDFLLGLEIENYLPNPKSRPSFSKWFRVAVESRGYNLYSLSKATNITTNHFYKWINGKTQPSLDSLIRIAKVLDCSLDYLLGREN